MAAEAAVWTERPAPERRFVPLALPCAPFPEPVRITVAMGQVVRSEPHSTGSLLPAPTPVAPAAAPRADAGGGASARPYALMWSAARGELPAAATGGGHPKAVFFAQAPLFAPAPPLLASHAVSLSPPYRRHREEPTAPSPKRPRRDAAPARTDERGLAARALWPCAGGSEVAKADAGGGGAVPCLSPWGTSAARTGAWGPMPPGPPQDGAACGWPAAGLAGPFAAQQPWAQTGLAARRAAWQTDPALALAPEAWGLLATPR